jgi:hypothetical protein
MFNSKQILPFVGLMLVLVVLLAGPVAAQQNVVGTTSFYASGSPFSIQSNSAITLGGGHSISCAQDPVWRRDEVTGKTATNTNLFGPCAVDGVLVHHIVLYEAKSGILMVLDMMDGTSWSLMLVNSAGVRITDLIDVGVKGQFAAPKSITFGLIGQQNQNWN